MKAVSEGDFSSSSNATKLSFKTVLSSSERPSETMSLSSFETGLLTVADDIVIKSGTIGGANDTDLLTLGNAKLSSKLVQVDNHNWCAGLLTASGQG